jgi:DNA-binding transcriptional LysR family regulator
LPVKVGAADAVDNPHIPVVAAGVVCFEPEPVPIHVVYPHVRHPPAKVRAFVDFLVQRLCSGEPVWHRGWA